MGVEIHCKSNALKKALSSERDIKRNYQHCQRGLILQLQLLKAVSNLSLVPTVRPSRRHQLSTGEWAVDVSPNYRLVFAADNGDKPENITSITLLRIEDYH